MGTELYEEYRVGEEEENEEEEEGEEYWEETAGEEEEDWYWDGEKEEEEDADGELSVPKEILTLFPFPEEKEEGT
jgi:hypothetical protein